MLYITPNFVYENIYCSRHYNVSLTFYPSYWNKTGENETELINELNCQNFTMAQNPRLSLFSFVDFEWKTILTALLLYGTVQFLPLPVMYKILILPCGSKPSPNLKVIKSKTNLLLSLPWMFFEIELPVIKTSSAFKQGQLHNIQKTLRKLVTHPLN